MTEGGANPPVPVPGFPELADAMAAWAPAAGPGPERRMRHANGSWRPLIPCDSAACRDGGFDLADVVRLMIAFREAEKRGILVCSGWEGEGPSGAEPGTPCVRTIRYRLTLAYRSAPPAPPPGAGEDT